MNSSINYIKGIAIMAMVLGHAAFQTPIEVAVNQFHMPLFFFVSGYCITPKALKTPSAYFRKRVLRIYWPYVKWGIFFLLLHNVFYHINFYSSKYGYLSEVSHPYTTSEIILYTIQTLQFNRCEQLIGGFWFLPTLFWASVIAYTWLQLTRRIKHGVIIGVIVFAILVVIVNHFQIIIPIIKISSREILATVFFLVGVLFSHYKIRTIRPVYCLTAIPFVVVGTNYWPIAMVSTNYKTLILFPYILAAIVTTWCLYSAFTSLRLIQLRFISFIGQNTLPILTWHFLCFKIVSFIIVLVYNLPLAQMSEFPVISPYAQQGWCVAYSIVAMTTISLAICCKESIRNFLSKRNIRG